jgi:uncharacterized protein YbaR (Trm112 family)
MMPELLQLLACPVCQDGELLGMDEQPVDGVLRCSRCHASYPVRGGIPILLPPGLDPLFHGTVPRQPPGGE